VGKKAKKAASPNSTRAAALDQNISAIVRHTKALNRNSAALTAHTAILSSVSAKQLVYSILGEPLSLPDTTPLNPRHWLEPPPRSRHTA
jgi:hypothetical protein